MIAQDSEDTTLSPTTVRNFEIFLNTEDNSYLGRFSVTASSIMTVVTLVILNKGYKRAKEVVNDAQDSIAAL